MGKLMYYTTNVGPDITNAVRELASQMIKTMREHWKTIERTVGYILHKAHIWAYLMLSICAPAISTCPTAKITSLLNRLAIIYMGLEQKASSSMPLSKIIPVPMFAIYVCGYGKVQQKKWIKGRVLFLGA